MQRKGILKISYARLIANLAQVGVSSQHLEGMDRHAQLEAWTDEVASGKDER